jgi:hypothetical protein
MSHPQYDDLLRVLHDFWRTPEDQLFICDPDSYASVGFFRSGGKTHVSLSCGRGPDAPGAEVLERLGFTFHRRLALNPKTLQPVPVYSCRRPAATPTEAADVAIAVILDFLVIPAETWLYITHTNNPDEWPLDLPRPAG